MAIFPVTQATAGDTLSVGSPSVGNAAIGISPNGIYSQVVRPAIISYKSNLAINVNLNHENLIVAQVGTAIRFTFAGAILQSKITAGYQNLFGVHGVRNAAQGAQIGGIYANIIGTPVVFVGDIKHPQFSFGANIVGVNAENVAFHFGPILIDSSGVGDCQSFGIASAVSALNIRPAGIFANHQSVPVTYKATENSKPMDMGLDYPGSFFEGRFNFGGASPITNVGLQDASSMGSASVVNTAFSIQPKSIYKESSGLPLTYSIDSTELHKKYGVQDISMLQGVQPQNALNIGFYFWEDNQASTISFQSSSFGDPAIRTATTYTSPQSWVSSKLGTAFSYNKKSIVIPSGLLSASDYGKPNVINSARAIFVAGINSPPITKPLIYNLRQYAPLQGKDQSSYGNPYMQGGVRWVTARSIAPLGVGKPALLNTTANQSAYPSGIARTAIVPAPVITPHMIYARGIYGTAFGSVKVIPTPVLRHKGVNHLEAGTPTIWYHTRPLDVSGFESYATGYPDVFDPAQFVQQLPFNRTAVFGDTYAKNVWTFVKDAGAIDSQAISEWATVEPRNKQLYAKSFVAQAFGDQLIKNKSPSIFFHGLPAPIFYSQAIGYRIRALEPTGFDRLALGKPTVIKTPELFPRSYVATQFGVQWVSNRTRYIEQYGRDYSATGTPIVWFRFRYARPNSWQSSRFSLGATVTHGVREVIANGFIQQGYGNAWVSRGVRLLGPQSIYKEYPSNHLVGRHQQINPLGFVATQFGTRIIPDIQALYPLGFTGMFGLAFADLSTRHLKTIGFATAGEQPAFRWGRQIVYNNTQYIIQNFAGDNGLVPPKWSDWTAIENRNKAIGSIGTLMQRFGYSQIDNNARLLEPQGLIATRTGDGMIAYRIRYLPLQGIEQPYMSDWLVVRNAARVIKPAGEVQSLFGNAELVKTRRYLDRIGRIESQEFGLGMIAYRIRTLDIERRYSIAPPIIRLPTVDLYTRYIEFNGYETAKYGLASLSIHFRRITPRWTHNEKSGYPALKNVTPELLTRGRDSQEYGNTSIRTQWRNVDAQGDNTALIGLHKISDTKQYIALAGFIDSIASQKHTVTQGESAPYSLQYIYLNDENNSNGGEGEGVEPPKNQVSPPYMNQNVIYHESRAVSSKFGTQFIWSNNLYIDGGIGVVADAVPSPMVRNKNNIISIEDKGIDSIVEVGEPRLSPHTIYAVKEAPTQAKRNHPAGRLHYVGEYYGGHASSRVGIPFVESTIRTLRPRWSLPSSYYTIGRPKAELSLHVIKTEGFRLGRFGVPAIPFTLQAIEIRLGVYGSDFGKPVMERPPYTGPQHISLKGIYSTIFGATYADNYMRYLNARGRDSLVMGQKKSGDTPFMWQGLRVGEHVPLIIGGDDTSIHGLTWISLRVRELGAEGFNTFRSEYDITDFNGKITVKNADKKLPSQTIVTATGIEPANTIGYQDIKLGQHYIRPDGNSDQFRKGGHYA